MIMFLVNLVDGVFRPSVAGLAIIAGLIAFTTEQHTGTASLHASVLNDAVCTGTLSPVCEAFTF